MRKELTNKYVTPSLRDVAKIIDRLIPGVTDYRIVSLTADKKYGLEVGYPSWTAIVTINFDDERSIFIEQYQYIAGFAEELTIDDVVDIMNDNNNSRSHPAEKFGYLRKYLGINDNIPDNIKLWVELYGI